MHHDITERLSEYIDGELTVDDRVAIDAHLAGCPQCHDVLNDLQRIVASATRLPDSLPERELWSGIARRVSRDAFVKPFEATARRRFSFTAWQLAAAGILLMLMSGGIVYMALPRDAASELSEADAGAAASDAGVVLVSLADAQFDGAVADLERTLEQGRNHLDPETVRVLEQNLEAIDKAIDQCRRALEADPANSFLNNHLVTARQRKLALLRRATALTTGS